MEVKGDSRIKHDLLLIARWTFCAMGSVRFIYIGYIGYIFECWGRVAGVKGGRRGKDEGRGGGEEEGRRWVEKC